MSAETLSAMSDAELSEVFAVEVAKCKFGPMFSSEPESTKVWSDAGGNWITDNEGQLCGPSFATDANAVLPFMPKEKHGAFWTSDGGFAGVRIAIRQQDEITCEGRAPTFTRAACIALILAKRKASK